MTVAEIVVKDRSLIQNKPSKSHLSKKQEVLKDYELLIKSRTASNMIRSEVLNGKAKFGIESAGKELAQIVLGKYFKKGDFYSGYYRDQTFMMKMGLFSVQEIFSSLYADAENDKVSGGRQMNSHFATPFLTSDGNWKALCDEYNVASAIAPLGGHIPRAMGIAMASKKYRSQGIVSDMSNLGNEVSFCILGDATTSEGIFFEVINASCVQQVPIVFIVQDDGYGISVPVEYQTTKGSISKALSGFQRNNPDEKACEIFAVNGWDYVALDATFKEAVKIARDSHTPCVVHIRQLTQGNGHSTSGSQERYKSKDRMDWERNKDCLVQFQQWILSNNLASDDELKAIKKKAENIVKNQKKAAWNHYQLPFRSALDEIKTLLKSLISNRPNIALAQSILYQLDTLDKGVVSHLLELLEPLFYGWDLADMAILLPIKEWHKSHREKLHSHYDNHLYSNSSTSALNVPVCPAKYEKENQVNGFQILNNYFDQLFESNSDVYAFGEDVGKIGGVNQAFAGLQNKYGENRIHDTGIREWTIAGLAIGMAMRGLRPIGEIQYLDYLVYALPALTDDLATMRWRTNGIQKSPTIIRTRGHRLEGIWHSGSPMSMLLGSLRGIYLLTPRNMTQAVGMYNTMLQSDDPAVIIEPLNGYRKKEKLPSNLSSFTVALGSPEVLLFGTDVTLVTYGSCVAIAQEAAHLLSNYGISVELIDVQTLLPFDLEHQITASIKKTNRVIFMDEDVPGGGTAYMMQQVLDDQEAFNYLESKPVTISAKDYRPPFGDNGNYVCKPMVVDVIKATVKLMEETYPEKYSEIQNFLCD